jgi:hypothetical protein
VYGKSGRRGRDQRGAEPSMAQIGAGDTKRTGEDRAAR